MNKICVAPTPTPTKPSVADLNQEFCQTIRHGNKIQVCRAIFREFFTNCCIQGFKYFCERKGHWSERIFWMVMFVTATCLSGLMIQKSYTKWDESPVIVSLSEKATPVWKIPFPAVTICPEVKVSAAKINLTEIFELLEKNSGFTGSMPKETEKRLEALTHICDFSTFDKFFEKIFTDASVIQILNDISTTLNESMFGCTWKTNVDCVNLFRPILTVDGLCFTFNSLNSRDIYTDEYERLIHNLLGKNV